MGQALVTLAVRMDRVRLSVPAEPAFHGALRLVVGGIGSRVRLTYEQVTELQLAIESLVAHRQPLGAVLEIDAEIDERSVSLRLGPFVPEEDQAGRRVTERLVSAARTCEDDGGQWVELDAGATRGDAT